MDVFFYFQDNENLFKHILQNCSRADFFFFFLTSFSDWPSHYLGKHYFLKLYAASFDRA